MRKAFFLIFSIAILFCYPDPPFDEVAAHNAVVLPNLPNIYLSTVEKEETSFENPVAFGGGRLLMLFPSVDRMISAENSTNLIWVWAEEHEASVHEWRPNIFGCNDYFERRFSSVNISGNITFTFTNLTRRVEIDENTPFEIAIPFSAEELNRTNGRENLLITVDSTIVFVYLEDKQPYIRDEFGGCIPSTSESYAHVCPGDPNRPQPDYYYLYRDCPVTFVRSFSDSFSYTVEGGGVLFFLVRPVLREQLAANNHFDNVVFSKRRFYAAEAALDGTVFSSATFLSFNISEDPYGLWRITSTANYSADGMDGANYSINITPYPIEKNNESFIYLYELNGSYNGTGPHTLMLTMTDCFGHQFSSSRLIASRELSLENVSDGNFFRKIAPAAEHGIYVATFPFTAFGVLLVAVLTISRLFRS